VFVVDIIVVVFVVFVSFVIVLCGCVSSCFSSIRRCARRNIRREEKQ
jgi:MFS superfamily sulfate permease-like transporter